MLFRSGVGGESVSAINVSNTGSHYSQGTTLSISGPDIPGGQAATFTYSINGSGNIAVTLTDGGSGYTSAPTLTVTKAATVSSTVNSGLTATNTFTVSTTAGIAVGMLIAGAATGSSGYITAINGNVITSTVNNNGTWTNASNLQFIDNGSGFSASVVLASVSTHALKVTAYLPTGSSAVVSDIMKQEASRRYLVRNGQGHGICKLVAKASGSLLAGEMNLIATDSASGTYYVTFVDGTTGYKPLYVDNATLTWNPSTNILSSSGQFVAANLSSSGDSFIAGDLAVNGGDITTTTTGTATLFNTNATGVTIGGAATGQVLIGNSAGTIKAAGDLIVGTNIIKDGTGGTSINTTATLTTIYGDLQVNGNDIKSSAGNTVFTLSGVNATAAGNLTVSGDLTVAGTASFQRSEEHTSELQSH